MTKIGLSHSVSITTAFTVILRPTRFLIVTVVVTGLATLYTHLRDFDYDKINRNHDSIAIKPAASPATRCH